MRSFFAPPFRCIFSFGTSIHSRSSHGNEQDSNDATTQTLTAPARRSDASSCVTVTAIHALDLGGGDGSVLGELRLVLGRGACGRHGGSMDWSFMTCLFMNSRTNSSETAAFFC